MTCFLQQYNIMTSIFWWTFISLVMLHLVVISQKLHLFSPLLSNETESSCPGTGLVEDVDQLFLFGTGTNLSNSLTRTKDVLFQERFNGQNRWNLVCTMNLTTCTGDNNTECGCDQTGNGSYEFHLNMTVRLHMNQSLYRLTWLDQSPREINSETQKLPIVWESETESVWSVQGIQRLKRSGKCEIQLQPNTFFSYCVYRLRTPFLIQIISWNKSPSEIISSEIISQHCVNTSGFSESGGLLAFTEFVGCQRRRSRYCSLKVTAGNEKGKQKGAVNFTVENHAIDVSEEFCSFILKEDVNVSITVCIQETQPPYNVTIVLGNHVMELTNFPQHCVSLHHTPSAATFAPNYEFIFIDRCQNNVTLICSAILFAKEPPGGAGNDGQADGTSRKGEGDRFFGKLVLNIIVIALLSILCLQLASVFFLSKKWKETEDAAMGDDESGAPESKFPEDVVSETTSMTLPRESWPGSEVDSVPTSSKPTAHLTSRRVDT